MGAGYNIMFDIWRYSYQDDDEVGGAVVSGTVAFWNVRARMEVMPTTQVFLEQGLETNRIFQASIPGTWDIRERDELEVKWPREHIDYGKHFRVVGVEPSDFAPRDPRNYTLLHFTRSVRAHARQ